MNRKTYNTLLVTVVVIVVLGVCAVIGIVLPMLVPEPVVMIASVLFGYPVGVGAFFLISEKWR